MDLSRTESRELACTSWPWSLRRCRSSS